MNYLAVKSVCMVNLNRQRANIVLSEMLDHQIALTPEQTAKKERVFERDGVLRWRATSVLGSCRIGTSFSNLLDSLGRKHVRTQSIRNLPFAAAALMRVYEQEDYLLWVEARAKRATIVLKQGTAPISQLKAWCHALLVARAIDTQANAATSDLNDSATLKLLEETRTELNMTFDMLVRRLEEVGWDMDRTTLETQPGRRLVILGKGNIGG